QPRAGETSARRQPGEGEAADDPAGVLVDVAGEEVAPAREHLADAPEERAEPAQGAQLAAELVGVASGLVSERELDQAGDGLDVLEQIEPPEGAGGSRGLGREASGRGHRAAPGWPGTGRPRARRVEAQRFPLAPRTTSNASASRLNAMQSLNVE